MTPQRTGNCPEQSVVGPAMVFGSVALAVLAVTGALHVEPAAGAAARTTPAAGGAVDAGSGRPCPSRISDRGMTMNTYEDLFPPSARHIQWQAEVEACAAERQRELQEILRRVATKTHTPRDVQRLVSELDIELPLP